MNLAETRGIQWGGLNYVGSMCAGPACMVKPVDNLTGDGEKVAYFFNNSRGCGYVQSFVTLYTQGIRRFFSDT